MREDKVEDPMAIRSLLNPTQPRNHGVSQSNRPYTQEEVDWIRFYHDDLSRSWSCIPVEFQKQFGGCHCSKQCFNSRYYRDNQIPVYNDKGDLVKESDGRPKLRKSKVRGRQESDLGIPYKLVEKHPERALEYSWVNEEKKKIARDILALDAQFDARSGQGLNSKFANKTPELVAQSDASQLEIDHWRWRKLIQEAESYGGIEK